jgi:hypothetical protein
MTRRDIIKKASEAKGEKDKSKEKLTSQHLAGRLDNAKDKRIAFLMMQNLRSQA